MIVQRLNSRDRVSLRHDDCDKHCAHAQRSQIMNEMISRKQAFKEDTHFWVMRSLAENPHLNQRALAKALGISLGSVNYCLQALIEKGLLKVNNFTTNPNKLNYTYLLTPKGLTEKASLTVRFLKRKQEEYAMLQQEIEALQLSVDELSMRDNGH